MPCSRRQFGLLLPALLTPRSLRLAGKGVLPAKAYRFEDLPTRVIGDNRLHPIVQGETHTGFPIEVHQTDLAPGGIPHAPHRHEHEELFLVREGTLEATIAGERTSLAPGSAAYVASNVEHGIRNAGKTRAQYFVIALGQDEK
jgi:quercetin dioxygenase-like cupin family protein